MFLKRLLKVCKVIVFDVDGTLIDGTEGILKSVIKAIKYFNLSMPDFEQLLKFVGPPIQNSCKRAFGTTDKFAQEFANYFRKEYSAGDVYLAKVYDGIYELLEYLKLKGYKLGVATYKRQDYAKELMKHFKFDRYFDSICGADNENKLKKIDILKNCMNELSAKKEETILIGDSVHDAGAAKELGIDFIGVTYGFGFKNKYEIKEYNPILCVDNVNEIIDYFSKGK